MKIWQLIRDSDKYAFLLPCIELGYYGYKALSKGTYRKWKKLKIKIDNDLPLSDLPGSGLDIVIFSKKAKDVLMPLIQKHVSLHQLNFEEEYYAVHVDTILDAIDYENSKYITFDDSDRIMVFEKYSFIENKVKGIPIFNIIDKKTSSFPFVSDEFKELVEKTGLTGFIFKLVWDSEESD